MNLRGIIYLGWQYLRRHNGKAALLISAISLSLLLPLAILLVVQQAETHLRARAEATPLLLGAHGSPLELVFNGLYFSKPKIATLTVTDAKTATGNGLARHIPIYARYQARKHRIIGTSIDYFRFRQLDVAKGRLFGRLGDCVLGSETAITLGLKPGDSVISTAEEMFNIAGVYPLKMQITGVLAPSGGADDRAIFCDLKTAWIIEGIAHGHDEAKESEVLAKEEGNTALKASVREYNEITLANVKGFHFHGDPDDFPISAAILLPKDRKSETILLGRYRTKSAPAQLIRPATVMSELFATVFQVRNLVVAALVAIGIASTVIAGLVFLLSNRLRKREFESLANIGADPLSVRALLGFEAAFVLLSSLVLVSVLAGVLHFLTPMVLSRLTG